MLYKEYYPIVGTECGRNIIHPNVWVNVTMNSYKPIDCSGNVKCSLAGKPDVSCNKCPQYPNWIITDVRFPNEVEAIKKRDGFIIRLQHEPFKWIDNDALAMETGKNIPHVKEHYSETALDLYKFDYVINNNGTILELIEEVQQILIKENIL